METLLAGLLRYSRLGRVALSIRPLNINGMIAEIIAATKFQLDEVGALLNRELVRRERVLRALTAGAAARDPGQAVAPPLFSLRSA